VNHRLIDLNSFFISLSDVNVIEFSEYYKPAKNTSKSNNK